MKTIDAETLEPLAKISVEIKIQLMFRVILECKPSLKRKIRKTARMNKGTRRSNSTINNSQKYLENFLNLIKIFPVNICVLGNDMIESLFADL